MLGEGRWLRKRRKKGKKRKVAARAKKG